MAETQDDTEKKVSDMESKIKAAMLSRASYFHEQADSLTLERVRRLLEKDLGLENQKLDAHKRFVKQWLQPCIESAILDKLPGNQEDAGENVVSSTGEVKPTDDVQTKSEIDEPGPGNEEKMEDSPVMGLMTGPKKEKNDPDLAEDTKSNDVPSESTIKKAIWTRASYLKENSENVTLAGLRRLLEEDLELEKHTLDPFKKFINQQVDQVMESPDVLETTTSRKKKNTKKQASGKASSISSEEAPPSSGSDMDEVEEDVKVNKKSAPKGKLQKSVAVKKRKRAEEGTKGARKKQNKVSKPASENSEENDGDVSGDDNSEASAEKPVKKKEAPTSSYGKKAEHLKTVIKSCGLSVPPSIYKRVKQAPEHKREACLIKELEEVLAKEGLSSKPSEKEIKDVKKRKEKARELEGIDLSNIVSSSRRRSTTSFVPPPKPKIQDSESESEESDNDDGDDDDDDDDDDDEVVVEEEVEEDQENGGNDSQNEVEEDQENGGNGSQNEESEEANGDSD